MLSRRDLLTSAAVVATAPFLPAIAAPSGLIQQRVYTDAAGNLVIGEPEPYRSMEDYWRESYPEGAAL